MNITTSSNGSDRCTVLELDSTLARVLCGSCCTDWLWLLLFLSIIITVTLNYIHCDKCIKDTVENEYLQNQEMYLTSFECIFVVRYIWNIFCVVKTFIFQHYFIYHYYNSITRFYLIILSVDIFNFHMVLWMRKILSFVICVHDLYSDFSSPALTLVMIGTS